MKYDLLKQILPFIEEFEGKMTEQMKVSDFAMWILKVEKEKEFAANIGEKGEEFNTLTMRFVDNARLLVKMYRYAKMYSKKVLTTESLILFDDYSYLIPLYYQGKMTKMQLIQQNVHEKSSGMEIIKRLLRIGLIAQMENEEDKRSKYVFLTEKGNAEMAAIQANMWQLTANINGNLTPEETNTLFHLLEKMDVFHEGQRNL